MERKELTAVRLREAREALGLTQDRAAEAAECSTIAIWRYENGERKPSPLTVRGLAQLYACSYQWLMGYVDVLGEGADPSPAVLTDTERKLLGVIHHLSDRGAKLALNIVREMQHSEADQGEERRIAEQNPPYEAERRQR